MMLLKMPCSCVEEPFFTAYSFINKRMKISILFFPAYKNRLVENGHF